MRAPLLGRDAELAMLHDLCRRAGSSGASMLLRGDAGVGKTALLDSAGDAAAAAGYAVLRATAVRGEAGLAFACLNQLLLPLEGLVAGLGSDDHDLLTEALGLVEPSGRDARPLAAAVVRLLRRASEVRPLLMVVDDIGWVDEHSARVLGLVTGRLDQCRTAFLAAGRSRGAGHLDHALPPSTEVAPLGEAAAVRLVQRHRPGLDPRQLPDLLRRSRGNPLALLELPGSTGWQHPLWGDATILPLGRRARTAFAADLLALPAETRRLLLVLVLEGTGDASLWSSPSGPPELRPATAAGLVSVEVAARRVHFCHPLVPLTLLGLATSDDRRRAHRELARLLVGRPDQRALHLAAATTSADEAVATELEDAASALAESGEPAASVALLLRSASLSAELAQRARRLVRAARTSVFTLGDLHAGRDQLRQAVQADPAVVRSLGCAVTSAAVLLHRSGDGDAAHRILAEALAALGDQRIDQEEWAEAVDAVRHLDRWVGRPRRQSPVGALADRQGRPGRAWGRRLVNVLDERGRDADDAFTTGDWDRALRLVDEGLAECDRGGDQLGGWTLRRVALLVAAARGDLAAVRGQSEEMLRFADRHQIGRVAGYAHHGLALAALGSGSFERAYREATAALESIAEPAGTSDQESWTLEAAFCRAEAAVYSHRTEEAAREAELGGREPGSARTAWLLAASTAIAGCGPGRTPLVEAASTLASSAHHPFELARLHLAHGHRLRRSRATSAAREELRAALDLFRRLDAQPWVERATAELEATGATRSHDGPALLLTPRERSVALLAASGHTNKQIAERLFLTHRTVAAHLHQVFPKLGVDSRAALRDALGAGTSGPLQQGQVRPQQLMGRGA